MNFLLKTRFYFLSLAFYLLNTLPTNAADRIFFNYGPMQFSVSVETLAVFVEEGKIEPELGFYLNRLTPKQQTKFRNFMRSRYQVNPIIISRFSHSSAGKRLINEVGELINLPGGKNGFYGVRGALVQTAQNPEGINLINFMRNFPTDIYLNTEKIMQAFKNFSNLNRETAIFIQEISQNTQENITSEKSINPEQLSALQKTGNFKIKQQTITYEDTNRKRRLNVDFYLPETINNAKIPVVFIVNGIGARPNRFQHLAKNLASHGFAVIIPDNPGSSYQRQQDFYMGLHRENFDVQEFIDFPLDISYLLDQLEATNSSHFHNILDLEKVGVFGYSFGGATALSLAGGKINFEQLEKDCGSEFNPINISAFYQCRILELPREEINQINLKDERIKAVYLFVPFGKSIFGESGLSEINIPIFWQATDKDLITPLLLEQIPPFAWLNNSEKYLVISEGLPHALITLNAEQQANSLEKIRSVMETYQNTLSLLFFKAYVFEDEQYLLYLEPSSIYNLSEKPYNLNLIRKIDRKFFPN